MVQPKIELNLHYDVTQKNRRSAAIIFGFHYAPNSKEQSSVFMNSELMQQKSLETLLAE